MLTLRDVCAHYGHIQALHGVTLMVPAGAFVALLGPNGAGKSTTLKTIVGLMRATGGQIMFESESLVGIPPDRVMRRGISLVPEGRELFLEMAVRENLEVGGYTRSRHELHAGLDRVFDLFPRLRDRREQIAGTLSGGEQQMLAIGRTLMAQPRLLLLDEPSLGLAPAVIGEIFDTIVRLQREGTTILLVEQNVEAALALADYGFVLEHGRVARGGTAAELAADITMKDSFLGQQLERG